MKTVPDIPFPQFMRALRLYVDNGRDDLFYDHLLWLLQNFRFSDDGAFLVSKEAA